VEPLARLNSNVWLPALPKTFDMDGKLTETGTNTLDYYDKTTIMAVKIFEVKATGFN
jgi:hypothetical protein